MFACEFHGSAVRAVYLNLIVRSLNMTDRRRQRDPSPPRTLQLMSRRNDRAADRPFVGSVFGYHVGLYGDARGKRGTPFRYDVPGGHLITSSGEDLFKARVAPFSLESIVLTVAAVSRIEHQWGYGAMQAHLSASGRNPFALQTSLLRRLVTESIVARELPDAATEAMGIDEMMAATEALMLWTEVAHPQFDDSYPVDASLMRLLQNQYHDQLSETHFIQELWLALETITEASRLGLDVQASYEDALGITFSELAALSFATYATLTESGGFALGIDPTSWAAGNHSLQIAPERIKRFFQVTAADVGVFKRNARHPQVVVAGFEPYALSPLVQWPFLRVGDSGLLVPPILRDLLERPTRAMSVEGLSLSEKRDGTAGASRFANAVGIAYEKMIGRTLSLLFGQKAFAANDVFLRPEAKRCDFVIEEGQCLTLVEVKTTRFKVQADATKLPTALRQELGKDGGLADGVVQLYRSAMEIQAGETRFDPDVPLVGLLIARGDLVLLNIPYVRRILQGLVEERLGQSLPLFRWQIANDVGFSSLAAMTRQTRRMGPWLHDKCRADSAAHDFRAWWDIHLAVDREFPSLPEPPLTDTYREALDRLFANFGIDLEASAMI